MVSLKRTIGSGHFWVCVRACKLCEVYVSVLCVCMSRVLLARNWKRRAKPSPALADAFHHCVTGDPICTSAKEQHTRSSRSKNKESTDDVKPSCIQYEKIL